MQRITKILYDIYDMDKTDWLGYEILDSERLDFHHITKREDGGKKIIANGAVLNNYDHKYLHIVEYKDLEMYLYLNAILRIINNQGHMPTTAQLKAIDSVLKEFEREHCSDVNAKGEYLIKERYTRRLIK